MFDCTPVFHANQQSTAKVVVNQGGTSSSKTYSIIQLLYLKAITEANAIVTVVGESIPNLKKGAYRDAEMLYHNTPELKRYIQFWNKSDRVIYFKNGSIIEFSSYEDSQSAKNGKRDYLFVNEANGVDYLVYWQLSIRTRKQIFIDYNPSAPFWAHDQLIGTEGVQLIISDHRHNPFLSEEDHRKIESIPDKELWRVYARGLTGNITGIIFPNWTRIHDGDFPWDEPFIGGLDFGTNDPNAGVKTVVKDDKVFFHELLYQPALPAIQIKQIFVSNGFTENTPVYCDHHPEYGVQMRREGGCLWLPARKGAPSIEAGIMKLKEYKVFYTASSENLHEERKRYVWINDKHTGKPTNAPIDMFNHLIDAGRYSVFTHYFRG